MENSEYNVILLAFATALAVFVGLTILAVCIRNSYVTKTVVWAAVAFGAIGAMLLLTPKWTEIALKISDFEAKISRLDSELVRAQRLNAHYERSISSSSAAINEVQQSLGRQKNKVLKPVVADRDISTLQNALLNLRANVPLSVKPMSAAQGKNEIEAPTTAAKKRSGNFHNFEQAPYLDLENNPYSQQE